LLVKHLSEQELESSIRREQNKRFAERLIFIRDLYAGEDVEKAAKKLGRCRATGFLWLNRWNKHGLEGLKPTFGGGRPSKLSCADLSELKQKLQNKSYWTPKEAKQLIQNDYGIDYSADSVSRILRSFGMRYGKPYPRDYRRPDDAEAKLKNSLEDSLGKLDDLEANYDQEPRNPLYSEVDFLVGFMDQCSPQSCANTVRVYSFGKAISVKDSTKYRANTFGFYAPGGVSIAEFMENSKKESVCSFLEEIGKSNPKTKIALILDNFPSHKAKVVREKAEELGIALTFLPPHSPDLNPIEQIWRCLKREISTALFRCEDEFRAIILNAYRQLSKRSSFASNWFAKFLPQWSNQLCG
jgi:transposase